jgi:hypothetical protein
MAELRDLFPELARKMAEDFDWCHRAFFFDEVLIDYTAILDYATDIQLLPDPEPAREAAKAIQAFLKGHDTREGLKNRLKEILEDWEKKTEGQGATIREVAEELPDDELPF